MPRRAAKSNRPSLVALGFADEAGQRLCLDLLSKESPESYVAVPGEYSVIFEEKDLTWIRRDLARSKVKYEIENVSSMAELPPDEAARLRSGRLEELLSSDFMNDAWAERELKRLEAE